MKRLYAFGAMLFVATNMMAQKKVESVSIELLGAQNTIGINYDRRLKGNSGL